MLHLTGGFLRCPIGQALLQELLRETGHKQDPLPGCQTNGKQMAIFRSQLL